jgi:hypothetical protein
MERNHSQPVYNCPSCRKEVETRPVQDFMLKSIVRAIGQAMGEIIPVYVETNGENSWDKFFGHGASIGN